jgi:F0F1-type ATP synthase membrane subunit c/vacuolar-type H+-ATPase subunit K
VFYCLHNIRCSIRHRKVRRRNLPIWHPPSRHDDAKHVREDELNINKTVADTFSLCAIMAQILSIYGLVASVIMSNNIKEKMAIHTAFLQLGAGISVGLCGMAAGFAIGIVGDAGGMFTPGLKAANLKTRDNCLTTPSSCKFAAATSLYRNGPHPHLCRGSRLIRCHCVHPYANSFHRSCNRMQVLRHTKQSAIASYDVRP